LAAIDRVIPFDVRASIRRLMDAATRRSKYFHLLSVIVARSGYVNLFYYAVVKGRRFFAHLFQKLRRL